MAKPLVAIVGRPNVGTSTFFNKMAGRRVAIVEDTPGVTRDRVYADCEWQNYRFTMIDTGGIDPGTPQERRRAPQDSPRANKRLCRSYNRPNATLRRRTIHDPAK